MKFRGYGSRAYADVDFVSLVWVHFGDCCAHAQQMDSIVGLLKL